MKETLFKVCTIEAPCKINLHLKIGEKRPDGFHSLESLFAPLAFGDTLRFECNGKEGDCSLSIAYESPVEPISPENNLIIRAVSLFRELTGYKNGLNIHLNKRIPVGAGLGGGSSDAASTLLALNSLANGVLSMKELAKTAALLGSDVPFFLTGGAAFVSGRGELVEPVDFSPNFWVILVKPPFSSETTHAFKLLDRIREDNKYKNKGNELSKEILLHALKGDPGAWSFQNDFLSVFSGSYPLKNKDIGLNFGVYDNILGNLRQVGASFTGLSGSGSCCFGIFSTKGAAEKAVMELPMKLRSSAAFEGQEKQSPSQANFVRMTFFLARRADPVLEY